MRRRCWILSLVVLLLGSISQAAPKKLLLVGQGPDGHPPGTHEYVAGVQVVEQCLKGIKGIEILRVRADEPWKEGPELLERVDGVVLFVSEGARWMNSNPERRRALERLAQRGGGIVALHWAMGTRKADHIATCLKLLGGCHGGPDRKYKVVTTQARLVSPKHPISTGIETKFKVHDEFYYQLKFAKPGENITPLLQVTIDDKPETVAWAWKRPDGGRSFGFSGLHFHENWRLEPYRRLVCQGVLWTLDLPIPEKGLAVELPSLPNP